MAVLRNQNGYFGDDGSQNEKLMHYVQDYQIHLIDPAKLMEEDLNKFTSSLREVIEYIKYTFITDWFCNTGILNIQ